MTATDVDLKDTAAITEISVIKSNVVDGLKSNQTALVDMLSVSTQPVVGTNETTDQLTWTFNSGNEAFDYLADGETLTLTYTLELSDGGGGINGTHDVVINITGTEDGPKFSDGPDAVSLEESHATLSTSGTLTITDEDKADQVTTSHTLAVSGTSALTTDGNGRAVPDDPHGSSYEELLGMLTLSSNPILDATETTDTLHWTFDSNTDGLGQTFDYLQEGDTLILSYTITAVDDDGNANTEDVVITITGTNDDPVSQRCSCYRNTDRNRWPAQRQWFNHSPRSR